MNDVLWAAVGGGAGAALGGVLGALIGSFLPKTLRAIAVAALAAALGAAGAYFGPKLFVTGYDASTLEAELSREQDIAPMLAAWKQSEPDSYQRFLAVVVDAASQDRTRIAPLARKEISAAAAARFAYMDDANLAALIGLMRDEFLDLSQTRPDVCVAMYRGEPFGDISDALSYDVRKREMALLTAAFEARPQDGAGLDPQTQAQAMDRVLVLTRDKVGEDIAMLAADADLAGREARFCEVAASFYASMAALPDGVSAELMRSMLPAQ